MHIHHNNTIVIATLNETILSQRYCCCIHSAGDLLKHKTATQIKCSKK
jgi:hypothetical protein